MAINSIITHTYDLTSPLTITPLRHNLVSGDQMGDRFDVTVLENGKPVELSSVGINAYFIREADNSTIPLNGTVNENVASVVLPEACYAVPGRFTLTIKVNVGEVRHAVYVCDGAVLRSSTDSYVDPDHNIPDIQELLATIAQIESVTTEAGKATDKANAAASNAEKAVSDANESVKKAEKAVSDANEAVRIADKWGSVTATVTMLDADQEATVTLTDTETGKTLSFKLPRGLTGLTPNLKIGTVTTGAPGSKATATITGTADNPALNLTIPQGDIGRIDNLTVCGIKPDGSGNIELDVGGRNLILGSQANDASAVVNSSNLFSFTDDGFGYGIARINFKGTNKLGLYYKSAIRCDISDDESITTDLRAGVYCYSFDLRTNLTKFKGPQLRIYVEDGNGELINSGVIWSIASYSSLNTNPDEQWHRFKLFISIPDIIEWNKGGMVTDIANRKGVVCLGFTTGNTEEGGYFEIRRPKLEFGNVQTEWTPAPEDMCMKAELLDMIYPVGSVYMSISETKPDLLFGGAWERIEDRFLLAAGKTYEAGAEGGESTHKLTVEELAAHQHNVFISTVQGSNTENWSLSNYNTNFNGENRAMMGLTDPVGGSQPHNNMPPYLAVYMWKRVA